jgi:uncharacterized membrane protein YkoI
VSVLLTEARASAIATRFFEQLNSDVFVKKGVLDDYVWIITLSIGTNNKIRQIKIDANDGKILGYN